MISKFFLAPALAPRFAIAIAAGALFVVFAVSSLLNHGNFQTSAYDLGIFDQAFWRYSRALDNFNTVRGLSILGDHFSLIALIFAPLYRIYPWIGWSLALQALSVALGGVFLWHIARLRLPSSPWIGLALVLSYYLHPAVHSTLLWQYHEIVLASGLYIGLIWTYLRQRTTWFVVVILLLLACREDMPVTVAAFGLLAALEKRWRYALWALGLAIAWWVIAIKFAMPHFNGRGYFRHQQGLAPLFANVTNPQFYFDRIFATQSLSYAWHVFFPVGFIALFSPRHLLPALPTFIANILIGGYNSHIGFHYSVSVMPFIFWGAVEAMRPSSMAARFLKAKFQPWFAAAMIALTLVAYSQYSSLNLRFFPAQIRDWQANAPRRAVLEELNARVSEKEGIAASDWLLPHLSHREKIYLFPNPWKIHYWGVGGENPHHPNLVDYVVYDTKREEVPQTELLEYLAETGIFAKIVDEEGVLIFKRIRLEAPDRAVAVADFDLSIGLEFSGISMSPSFATVEPDFRRLDVDPVELQTATPGNWRPVKFPRTTRLMDFKLGEPGSSDFSTRYLRAVIMVETATRARLDLGSDDGITVWLNGKPVYENIVSRPARLGDDRIPVSLKPGENVFVFRVNNIGGASRLLARLKTP